LRRKNPLNLKLYKYYNVLGIFRGAGPQNGAGWGKPKNRLPVAEMPRGWRLDDPARA
jgi:hypothetical protein